MSDQRCSASIRSATSNSSVLIVVPRARARCDTGEVLLRGMTSVPADQRWFWQPDWQVGEREASEQINAGDVEVFDNVDAMFAALNE
jgi:hypothetical protein